MGTFVIALQRLFVCNLVHELHCLFVPCSLWWVVHNVCSTTSCRVGGLSSLFRTPCLFVSFALQTFVCFCNLWSRNWFVWTMTPVCLYTTACQRPCRETAPVCTTLSRNCSCHLWRVPSRTPFVPNTSCDVLVGTHVCFSLFAKFLFLCPQWVVVCCLLFVCSCWCVVV